MEGRPERKKGNILRWLFDSSAGPPDRMVPRWIFLRALAGVYFSAFYSLLFQIKGLIGPGGVLPARQYLADVAQQIPAARYWFAPTLYWFSASSPMLMAVTWIGLAASVIAFFNIWPRVSFSVCLVCFLSFVAAAGEFSGYQSDGMLLEAGFLALFFAPRGLRPGWGADDPPSRASLLLLQWEWFRIYFESGMVKLLSGDTEWRNFTAMDEYYQNGPLPTWIGWYMEHLPHWFHAATVGATLALELGVVFMLFFPRRVRLICFLIVTPWEAVVILSANYAFLNYLVLALGFLLLDDKTLLWLVPARCRPPEPVSAMEAGTSEELPPSILAAPDISSVEVEPAPRIRKRFSTYFAVARMSVAAVILVWIAYDTTAEMIGIPVSSLPLPNAPIEALEPFRIANQYGLFAVMTRGRYEIEFQGSNDGDTWITYPFQYKPQALNEPPGIYAPYQPRFEWNLWFASLGSWEHNDMVPLTEERLLVNDADVLALFRSNPFPQSPPRYVRAVLWQYWFTSMDEKRRTGNWWRREFLGLYAPEITRSANGRPTVVQEPNGFSPNE
jgi:hypothetical protein